ncbi:MAG: transposase, partial [Treponema sp.]|nr:transposase [Treponema sp.]
RGFALEGARLSFYIKPADGFLLPKIMQWLKQTFAVRFNLREGRTGHRWGDRYWSKVLEGEPPEGAGAVDWEAMEAEAEAEAPTAADMRQRWKLKGVRPRQAENGVEIPFSPEISLHAASPPA